MYQFNSLLSISHIFLSQIHENHVDVMCDWSPPIQFGLCSKEIYNGYY